MTARSFASAKGQPFTVVFAPSSNTTSARHLWKNSTPSKPRIPLAEVRRLRIRKIGLRSPKLNRLHGALPGVLDPQLALAPRDEEAGADHDRRADINRRRRQ